MKTFSPRFLILLVTIVFLLATRSPATAAEVDGWLLTVSPRTVARGDGPGDYTREIDRDLVLKAVLKNLSMKDREAGSVEYAILISRWGGETGITQRYAGKVDLKAVVKGEQVELNTGQYHIGGHLHGTSRMHVDDLEAWKFTVVAGAKRSEFRSSPKFDALDKRAVPAH